MRGLLKLRGLLKHLRHRALDSLGEFLARREQRTGNKSLPREESRNESLLRAYREENRAYREENRRLEKLLDEHQKARIDLACDKETLTEENRQLADNCARFIQANNELAALVMDWIEGAEQARDLLDVLGKKSRAFAQHDEQAARMYARAFNSGLVERSAESGA